MGCHFGLCESAIFCNCLDLTTLGVVRVDEVEGIENASLLSVVVVAS